MNISQVDLSLGVESVVCGALIGQFLSDVCTFQKLKAIEELKEQQASGKALQKNQVMFFVSACLTQTTRHSCPTN